MSVSLGIKDPLGTALMIAQLEQTLREMGLTVRSSNDMTAFAKTKKEVRNLDVGPMHDPEVCDFSGDRAFWMSLTNKNNEIVGLQGYRCDRIDVNLAEWCTNYMIGVYMRRQELMVPSHTKAPEGSIAWRLRGKLVYHGELWVEKDLKNRMVVELFPKIGTLLAFLKWNPDAIWALTGFQLATRGFPGRMGYAHVERGFLRWMWHSDNVEEIEYLAVAEREVIEQMVSEARDSAQAIPERVTEQISKNADA